MFMNLMVLRMKVGGDSISGSKQGEKFGYSVSINDDGNRIVIGAPYYDKEFFTYEGAVRVYEYDTTNGWEKLGSDIICKSTADNFGYSVSMNSSGTVIVIGAPQNNTSIGYTEAYEFNSTSSSWEQLYNTINGDKEGERSGYSVAVNNDGSKIAVGSPNYFDRTTDKSGKVNVYDYKNNSDKLVSFDDIKNLFETYYFTSNVKTDVFSGKLFTYETQTNRNFNDDVQALKNKISRGLIGNDDITVSNNFVVQNSSITRKLKLIVDTVNLNDFKIRGNLSKLRNYNATSEAINMKNQDTTYLSINPSSKSILGSVQEIQTEADKCKNSISNLVSYFDSDSANLNSRNEKVLNVVIPGQYIRIGPDENGNYEIRMVTGINTSSDLKSRNTPGYQLNKDLKYNYDGNNGAKMGKFELRDEEPPSDEGEEPPADDEGPPAEEGDITINVNEVKSKTFHLLNESAYMMTMNYYIQQL